MKVNDVVRVKKTGELVTITRIDRHVYPVCAGYQRYKFSDLESV